MATIQEKITEAKGAGYSDDEIVQHLSQSPEYGVKLKAALDEGYSPTEILTHLAPAPVAAAPKNEGIPAPRKSFADKVQGITEVPGVLLTGAAGTLAGNVIGPLTSLYEGSFGTQKGVKRAEDVASKVQQALTYAPRTQTGRDILSGISDVVSASKLEGLNPAAATELSALGAPVLQQGKAIVGNKLANRAAQIQETNVARSFDNAAQIDAANLAVKHKIVIDPAISNPTVANRLKSSAVKSTNFAENAAKVNDARFTQLAKEDMGLPPNTILNAKAFEEALNKHSAPYDAVRKISALASDKTALNEIKSLRIQRPTIGGEASATAVNSLVDEAIDKITAGRSGAEIITDIRKLRKDAKNVYSAQQKSGVPDPTLLAKADTSMGIANALENLIEANVSDPKLLGELRTARANMAKVYDYERATNLATNRIDPQVLAKMVEEGKPLSGIAADIGKIAAVFPDIAKTGQTGVPGWAKSFSRSSALGTAGFILGGVPGAAIGAATGYVGGGLGARRMASPAYQAKNALPRDFRPPVQNNLRSEGLPNTANRNNLRND